MSRSSWKGIFNPYKITNLNTLNTKDNLISNLTTFKNVSIRNLAQNNFLINEKKNETEGFFHQLTENYLMRIKSYQSFGVWQKKRSYKITPFHVDKLFYVYNGKDWKKVYVADNMVGASFGSFRWPKKKCIYRNKKKKKKSKK